MGCGAGGASEGERMGRSRQALNRGHGVNHPHDDPQSACCPPIRTLRQHPSGGCGEQKISACGRVS